MKLHHAVRIPSTLDVAPFVDGGSVARQHSQTKRTIVGAASPETESPSGPGGGAKLPPMAPLPPSAIGVDGSDVRMTVAMPEGQGKGRSGSLRRKKQSQQGHCRLFSLLMHSGSAGRPLLRLHQGAQERRVVPLQRFALRKRRRNNSRRQEGDSAPGATCYMCLFRR